MHKIWVAGQVCRAVEKIKGNNVCDSTHHRTGTWDVIYIVRSLSLPLLGTFVYVDSFNLQNNHVRYVLSS